MTKWMGGETIKLLKCDYREKYMLNIITDVNALQLINDAIDEINKRLKKEAVLGNRAKLYVALTENSDKEHRDIFSTALVHNIRHHDASMDKTMQCYPQPAWFDELIRLEQVDATTGLPNGVYKKRSARGLLRILRVPRDKVTGRSRRLFYCIMITDKGVLLTYHDDKERREMAEPWVDNTPGKFFFLLLQAGYSPPSIKDFIFKKFNPGHAGLSLDHSY